LWAFYIVFSSTPYWLTSLILPSSKPTAKVDWFPLLLVSQSIVVGIALNYLKLSTFGSLVFKFQRFTVISSLILEIFSKSMKELPITLIRGSPVDTTTYIVVFVFLMDIDFESHSK